MSDDDEVLAFGGRENLDRWRQSLRHTDWQSLGPLRESSALSPWWNLSAEARGFVALDVRMELLARAAEGGWSTLPKDGWARVVSRFRPEEQAAWTAGGPNAVWRRHGSFTARSEYCCWRACPELQIMLNAAAPDEDGDIPMYLPSFELGTYVDLAGGLHTERSVGIRPLVDAGVYHAQAGEDIALLRGGGRLRTPVAGVVLLRSGTESSQLDGVSEADWPLFDPAAPVAWIRPTSLRAVEGDAGTLFLPPTAPAGSVTAHLVAPGAEVEAGAGLLRLGDATVTTPVSGTVEDLRPVGYGAEAGQPVARIAAPVPPQREWTPSAGADWSPGTTSAEPSSNIDDLVEEEVRRLRGELG